MSPLARNIHHITIAVQGDNPSRIKPATNCGLPGKNVFARNVISGGAITQLAIIVTISGLGALTAFFMSLNCIPTTVGYIIKKSNIQY
jgi:hypothetical protein